MVVLLFGPAFVGPIISEFIELFLEGEGGVKSQNETKTNKKKKFFFRNSEIRPAL